MKFSIKDFFSKCDQICNFLRIWSHLLNKFLMENLMFCALSPPVGASDFYNFFYGLLKLFPKFIRLYFYNVLRALYCKVYITCNSVREFLDLICPCRYFALGYFRRGQKIINFGRRASNFS